MTAEHDGRNASMIDRVSKAICKSRIFETGQGTCAAICMGELGDARSKCSHCARVHGRLSRVVIKAMREPTSEMVRGVSDPLAEVFLSEQTVRALYGEIIDAALTADAH